MTGGIGELHGSLRRRELSAVELLEKHLAVIEREEPRVAAFLRVTEDLARAQAAEADRRLARNGDGDGLGPLTGIPVAIKDVLSV